MSNKQGINHQRYVLFLGVILLLGGAFYLLRSVLLPFVVGMVVAYFLDPLVGKLEKSWKFPRSLATILILMLFLLFLLPLTIFLGSIAVVQVGNFVLNFPEYIHIAGQRLVSLLHKLQDYFPLLSNIDMTDLWQENWSESVKSIVAILRKVIANGFAFINILSLLLISPVVAFYMLRDWPIFTKKIMTLIPKKSQKTAQEGVSAINRIISGYLRGQFLVCTALGCFYSFGLWLVDLNLGILVGFLAGIISFIPYVGSISGFLMAMVLVVTQYGTFPKIIEVIAVFVIGQFLEGNFLTPKLVGENIGLHPVWVMFALLAGGTLLGLLGMIIAVPVAAIIGVLLKYVIKHYKKSRIYLGS